MRWLTSCASCSANFHVLCDTETAVQESVGILGLCTYLPRIMSKIRLAFLATTVTCISAGNWSV
jgi:hypothetical protein